MGSGMLAPNAYVTQEHEFILILRKGRKREFKNDKEKLNRQLSAYFWSERNEWFSDMWTFKGIPQKLKNKELRNRSAAFPFELAYRLINMFSVKQDTVLDPFLGTGTTTIAAMASGRHSVGYEIDSDLKEFIYDKIIGSLNFLNEYNHNRLINQLKFIEERIKLGKPFKYTNTFYNFPVMTNQETNLFLNDLKRIDQSNDSEFVVIYEDNVKKDQYKKDWNFKTKNEVKPQKELSKFL
jgi:hypothetical protein